MEDWSLATDRTTRTSNTNLPVALTSESLTESLPLTAIWRHITLRTLLLSVTYVARTTVGQSG